MTAYKAAQRAEVDALKYAFECGYHLNLAKENVEEANGKWKSWCKENIPEIPQTTENLYRRLADAVANDENIFADCKSIRDAIKKLPKRERKQKQKREHQTPAPDANSNALLTGADLATTFQNVDVDEVCTALIDAWDEQHIRQLCDRLHAHFTKPKGDLPLKRAPSAPVQPSQ